MTESDGHEPAAPGARHLPTQQIIIVLVAWLGYAVAYWPLQFLLGTHTAVLAFVPVIVTSWLLGTLAGSLAAVAAVPVTVAVIAVFGEASLSLNAATVIGVGAMMLTGAAVGRMRDLQLQAHDEARRRARAEKGLVERKERLAVVNEIARSVWSDASKDTIARDAVSSLARRLPGLRTCYLTVAHDGRVTERYSCGADGSLRAPQTSLDDQIPSVEIDLVRQHTVLVTDNVALDPDAPTLTGLLLDDHRGAVLMAQVPHDGDVLGIVAIVSPTPLRWTAHQQALLEEASDALAVALADARRRQQLRESEEKFRTVAERSDINITLVEGDRVVYANRAFEETMGYGADDLEGMTFLDLVDPEFRAVAIREAAKRFAGAPLQPPLELKVTSKSGQPRWLELRGSTIQVDGRPMLLTTSIDVSARKIAEQQRRASDERLRSVLEQLLDGVAVIVDGTIQYANATLGDLLGRDTSSLIGTPMTEYLAKADREHAVQRLEHAATKRGQEQPLECEVVRATGDRLPIHLLSRPVTFEGGPAVLAIVRDVADLKHAQEALREAEATYRSLVENSLAGVFVIQDGQFVYVNPRFAEIFGYTEAELLALPADALVADVEQPSGTDGTLGFGSLSGTARRHRGRRKDGALVDIETHAGPTTYRGRRAVIGSVINVTERQHLEEQVHQMHRLESVGQLAGGVAHNFNNALTAIYGYSELLSRRFEPDDPALQDLEQIQRVAEQSASLTRQLLAFSRKEKVRPTRFSFNDAVTQVRELLTPLIGDHVRLSLALATELPDVHADRTQMEQVITNLVLNARDAMPDGGLVSIKTEAVTVTDGFCRRHPEAQPGPYVKLTVTDTGRGMDAATVSRIFEPFFTTKETGQGVGLGLALVHGAVKQTGGFITVRSRPDAGSSFSAYFPLGETTTAVDTRQTARDTSELRD